MSGPTAIVGLNTATNIPSPFDCTEELEVLVC